MGAYIVYYLAVAVSVVCACTIDNTVDCDTGHVLYMADSQDFCLSYNPATNPGLVLCVYPSDLCSLWTTIPEGDGFKVKLKVKDQDLLVNSGLSLTNTGQNFEMKFQDDAVPYDVFKIDKVTLNLEGANCMGIGDEIAGQLHLYEVVEMSHYGMVNMEFVPVCPESTKDRWHFKVSGPVYHFPMDLPCDLNPCDAGMTCTNNNDGSRTCTLPPTPCEIVPCEEGWTCTNVDSNNRECIITPKPCDLLPCESGQKCTNTGPDTRVCEDIVLTPCDKQPCDNGGQCLDNGDGTRTCDCSSTHNFLNLTGYEGQHCETACVLGCLKPKRNNIFRKCHMNETEINGNKIMCGQKPRRWECRTDCQPADNCKPVVCRTPTACDRRPCRHGGLCTNNDDGSRTCDCRVTYNYSTLKGYTGKRCDAACELGCLKPARNDTFRTCKSHLNKAQLNGTQILCGQAPRKWKCRTDCQPEDGCIPVLCKEPDTSAETSLEEPDHQ